MLSIFFVIALTMIVSWFGIKLLLPFLSKSIVANPNIRSSHVIPTPSGGGLVFVFIVFLSILYSCVFSSSLASFSIFFGILSSLPLAIVGFFDDRHNHPALTRFDDQINTVFCLIFSPHCKSPHMAIYYFFSCC